MGLYVKESKIREVHMSGKDCYCRGRVGDNLKVPKDCIYTFTRRDIEELAEMEKESERLFEYDSFTDRAELVFNIVDRKFSKPPVVRFRLLVIRQGDKLFFYDREGPVRDGKVDFEERYVYVFKSEDVQKLQEKMEEEGADFIDQFARAEYAFFMIDKKFGYLNPYDDACFCDDPACDGWACKNDDDDIDWD